MITRLEATRYRCFERLGIDVGDFRVLVGANGSGKTTLLDLPVLLGELLRTIGFSSAPGLIRVVGIIPGLATLVQIAAQIWMLVAMVIAVRQALDYTSTFRAVGVCIIGWLIQLFFIMVLFWIFGGAGR